MNEKIREFLRNDLGYIVVGFVSLVYILTAFLVIDRTGKSPAQMLADGAIAFFLGLFINRIFELQGMTSGEREERVQATRAEHGAIVLRISPYIDKLDAWCERENKRNYKLQRTKLLARVGLRYEDHFDEDGVAKPWIAKDAAARDKSLRRIEARRRKAFVRASALKLTPLSSGELTSDGAKQHDPYYFGRTKAQYEAQHSLEDVISKLGTALIFGYYGVSLIESFDRARLIWTTLQVATFLIMGVIKMYQAYGFVVDEFRGRMIKKIDNLQKFENYTLSLSDVKEKTSVSDLNDQG